MVLAFGSVAASAQTGRQSASISAARQMIFLINVSFGHAWRVSVPLKWEPQLAHISKLGLNRKIKKFSDSFICGKGWGCQA